MRCYKLVDCLKHRFESRGMVCPEPKYTEPDCYVEGDTCPTCQRAYCSRSPMRHEPSGVCGPCRKQGSMTRFMERIMNARIGPFLPVGEPFSGDDGEEIPF